MSIDLIEFAWITINLITFVLTVVAIADAKANQAAVKLLNGYARELAAAGALRREWVRLFVQFVFLGIAVPSMFTVNPERTPAQYIAIGLLMAAALVLLLNTVKDRRDREKMTVLVAADVLHERESFLSRIEAKLDENTLISQAASEHADAAYQVANNVNEKIARQGEALVAQGEVQEAQEAGQIALAGAITETIEDTHDKVIDIHEATKPQ